MVITNVLVNMKLSEYRSLYEQLQQIIKEQYGIPAARQDDQLMLCHALDDGITRMKELLKLDGAKEFSCRKEH